MCSYCGCQAIEVIGRYTREHENIITVLVELRDAVEAGDDKAVAQAAAVVADALDPHTQSEERSLFAELRKDEEFTDHVDKLCAEHTTLDAQLARIAGGDTSGYHDFEVGLRNHMDREENGLFPAAAVTLSGDAWERIHELA